MNTLSTAETLPWLFTGAHPSLDGKYAIGAIVSEKIGGAVVALSYDGHDMETNLTRLNEAGRFIVEKVNGADGQDCALQLTCAEAIARQIAIKDFAYSDAFTTPPSRSYVQVSKEPVNSRLHSFQRHFQPPFCRQLVPLIQPPIRRHPICVRVLWTHLQKHLVNGLLRTITSSTAAGPATSFSFLRL